MLPYLSYVRVSNGSSGVILKYLALFVGKVLSIGRYVEFFTFDSLRFPSYFLSVGDYSFPLVAIDKITISVDLLSDQIVQ